MDNYYINFSNIVYELYKIDWCQSHGITLKTIMNKILDYCEEEEDIPNYEAMRDYIQETGFDDSLYVSYKEFLIFEYQDESYIKSLLGDNPKLIKEYHKSLKDLKGAI